MDAARLKHFLDLAHESQSSPTEGYIAAWWVRMHFGDYDDFDFQKHVGQGQDAPANFSDSEKKQWYHATRKRVDIVAYNSRGATIVECKDHIDGAAIRQARDYCDRWKHSPATPPVIECRVVGRSIDPGVPDYAAQFGIKTEVAIVITMSAAP